MGVNFWFSYFLGFENSASVKQHKFLLLRRSDQRGPGRWCPMRQANLRPSRFQGLAILLLVLQREGYARLVPMLKTFGREYSTAYRVIILL